MDTEIQRLSLGISDCYLIKGEGTILVDAGTPNKVNKLHAELQAISIDPHDITLLLITHGHWDNIGSASAIRALTGCKVAVNYREKDWVENAQKTIPPGIGIWGKIFSPFTRIMMPFVQFPASHVDIALEDKEFPLQPFGINGKVIHTPGHTPGSMSLLLDTGEAFVGDLAMNALPMRLGPGMPSLGEGRDTVKASWRLLLDNGADWIYPSHGKPFSADILRNTL